MSIFTTEEAAEYLRLKPKTLQRWRTENRGPKYIEPERNMVRYLEQDIIDWLAGSDTREPVEITQAQELTNAISTAKGRDVVLKAIQAVGECVQSGKLTGEEADLIVALAADRILQLQGKQ